jgi:hypothetical protein
MPATALASPHVHPAASAVSHAGAWPPRASRRWTWAAAALLHVPLLLAMLHARIGVTIAAGPVAELAVLPAVVPHALPSTPLPSPAAPRLRIPPVVLPFVPAAVSASLPPGTSGATTAIAAAPPASAASAPPLILTLSPAQLRAIAGASRTGTAHGDRTSTLSALGPDGEMLHLKALPHGETEVHIHGSCYRLVPSMPSRFDPFNHANETLVAPCG